MIITQSTLCRIDIRSTKLNSLRILFTFIMFQVVTKFTLATFILILSIRNTKIYFINWQTLKLVQIMILNAFFALKRKHFCLLDVFFTIFNFRNFITKILLHNFLLQIKINKSIW